MHVAHDVKYFSPCVYSYLIDNYPTPLFYHKLPKFVLYEYKVEGSGRGFNRKRGLAETDSYFIIKFDMF